MSAVTGDLRMGGTWRAQLDDGGEYAIGTVTECSPPRSFVTSWRATDEQPTTLTVTIDPVPEGTRLRLRHDGVQSIYYGAGWQTYLEQLDDYVGAAESSVIDPTRTAGVDWDERYLALRDPWEKRFGALRD